MKSIKNFLILLSIVTISSCTSVDDFAIPEFAKTFINLQGNDLPNFGTAQNEVAFNRPGWQNFNTLGTRVWNVRRNFIFNTNEQRYVEFNSFDSNAAQAPNDEAWLISPPLDFSNSKNEAIQVEFRSRFFNGNVLQVLFSTNYDGNPANVNEATWEPLALNIPVNSGTATDPFVTSNIVSIANEGTIRIAFKYNGSKLTGPTSTIQISRILIFENNEQ